MFGKLMGKYLIWKYGKVLLLRSPVRTVMMKETDVTDTFLASP